MGKGHPLDPLTAEEIEAAAAACRAYAAEPERGFASLRFNAITLKVGLIGVAVAGARRAASGAGPGPRRDRRGPHVARLCVPAARDAARPGSIRGAYMRPAAHMGRPPMG
jgi:hypothetical protein